MIFFITYASCFEGEWKSCNMISRNTMIAIWPFRNCLPEIKLREHSNIASHHKGGGRPVA